LIRNVLGTMLAIGFAGMIGMILTVLLFGVNQDFVLFEINDVAENMASAGVISNATATSIETTGNQHAGLIGSFDWVWFGFYVMMFISSIGISYFLPSDGEIGFVGMLFFGTMVLLFVVSIITVVTDWMGTELLYKMMPNLEGNFPKFDFVMDNIGILSMVNILMCIFANKLDLKLIRSRGSKTDVEFTDSGEVL